MKIQYQLFRWNAVDAVWSYCNSFKTFDEACDYWDWMASRWGGQYEIRIGEYE